MTTIDNKTRQASSIKQYYTVKKKDLPLHCPTDNMSLWNSHPRVYLPIEDNDGIAKCPYCGTQFKLSGD